MGACTKGIMLEDCICQQGKEEESWFELRSMRKEKRKGYINTFKNSHKEQIDSLEGSMYQASFAAELEFSKIPIPRLLQNLPSVNIKCAGKSKQLHSLPGLPLGALITLFYVLI